MRQIWVAVKLENEAGMIAVHYVHVDHNFVQPEAEAASIERSKGYNVLEAWLCQ